MTRALLFILGGAFFVALYDTQLERMQPLPQVRHYSPCPVENAAGQALAASMVHASYIKGEPQPHECLYR